jgi:predicted nucleic-acid-binding protein
MTSTPLTNYYEELEEYYKLKNKYMLIKQKKVSELNGEYGKDYDQKKQILAKYKPKCVNCKQDGGTIFTETPELLRATCGSTFAPCKLDLSIQRKKFAQIPEKLATTREDLEKYKKNIITTKLDFLFNYIEEEKAVELFETLKHQLNNSQESYNNLVNLYNSITNNEELKQLIQEKITDFEINKKQYGDALDLFKSSGEISYLKSAVEIHNSKLAPLGNELMNLKYKSSHIEKNELDQFLFFQNSYNLEDLIIESNTKIKE